MKGFLYLVEIAVAGILASIILASFFSAQTVQSNWGRSDLIAIGNNVFDILGNDTVKLLNETELYEDKISELMPSNVRYSIGFKNIPKSTIKVGTNVLSSEIEIFLRNSYLNGRWINYEVEKFDLSKSLDKYDVLVLKGYDYAGSDLTVIEEFSKTKTVIGIENTDSVGLRNFYDLESSGTSIIEDSTFKKYDNIANYFMGIGFIVYVPQNWKSYYYGNWKIYDGNKVITTGPTSICYGNDKCEPTIPERTKFFDTFFVKQIGEIGPAWGDRVFISIKDDNFVFNKFTTTGFKSVSSENVVVGNSNYDAVTKYGNRIFVAGWTSPSDISSEYYTLVQAIVASSVMEWQTSEIDLGEVAKVSRFVPLCCDIPEVAEISLTMWYVF